MLRSLVFLDMKKHLFPQFLARPKPDKPYRNIFLRGKAGKGDEVPGEIDDLYLLAHIQDEYLTAFTHGAGLEHGLVVQDGENGKTLVSAIDPVASMQAVDNSSLTEIAGQVRAKLQRVIENL